MAPSPSSWLSMLRNRTEVLSPPQQTFELFHDARDNDDWLSEILDTPCDPTLASQRLPHMPSLLSKALPPCGPDLQIAYQNVLHRLRFLWLQSPPPNSLLDMCKDVEVALAREDLDAPTYTRKPWRRDSIFVYEVRWVKYFLREARIRELWEGMSKEEKQKQEFMHRLYVIPKELGIVIRKKGNREGVLEKWRRWNKEKREDLSAEEEEEYEEDEEGWETVGDDVEGGDRVEEGNDRDVAGSIKGLEL